MSLAVRMSVDNHALSEAIKAGKLTRQELLDIRGAGAKVIINKQRELCPVDTAATKLSINSHIITATAKQVIDDIGPETEYAPPIEYGRADMPNYPIQPFVRPSVSGDQPALINRVVGIAFEKTMERKWQK